MTDSDRVARRGFLRAVGSVAASTALVDTVSGADNEMERRQIGDERVLELTSRSVSTLDPIEATDTTSLTVIQQLFDSLTAHPNGELTVEGRIAADYEISADFRTYTFTLKPDVTFHDGSQVTAADVAYAFERLAAADRSRRAYFVLESAAIEHETENGEYVPGSLAVTAIDDLTLQITLQRPFHSTLSLFSYPALAPIPEGFVDDVPGYLGRVSKDTFAKNPVGCGPFHLDYWDRESEILVRRFDNYHGQRADVNAVHWQIIEDEQSRFEYAANGNADIVDIPTSMYDTSELEIETVDGNGRVVGTYGPLPNGESVDYLAVPTGNTFYIGFNTDRVDRAVRRAFAYAADQEMLVKQVFKGRGEPAFHVTPPYVFPGGGTAYDAHVADAYPYNHENAAVEEARAVMKDAGYGPARRYDVTFTIYQSSTWRRIAAVLRDVLTTVYVDLDIVEVSLVDLLRRGLAGDLEAYALGWIMDWPAPDNFLQLLYPPLTDTSRTDAVSYTNWRGTDAADRAMRAWSRIHVNSNPTDEDEAVRDAATLEMERANWEDVVFLPVFHRLDERFTYPWVNIPPFGAVGAHRQQFNSVTFNRNP